MKTFKTIVTITLLYSTFFSAQITKKNWLVGGSGSISSNTDDVSFTIPSSNNELQIIRYETVGYTLTTKIGYFPIDKLAFGLSFLTGGTKIESSIITGSSVGAEPNSTFQFAAGPFIRYYFLKVNKPYNILVEANYLLGRQDFRTYGKEKANINSFSILAGPEIFFNSSVGIEFLFGYKLYNDTYENKIYSSVQTKNLQFAIGIQIHLQKN